MTILRTRASSFVAASFTNVANVPPAGDGSYATWANASRRGETTGVASGFDYSAIGTGQVNSVTLEVRDYISAGAAADFSQVAESVAAGTWAPTAAAAVHSVPLGTALPSSITLTFTRGNNTRSTTYSIDWVDVVVDYSELRDAKVWNGSRWAGGRAWDGTQWVTPQFWNGSRWVPLTVE